MTNDLPDWTRSISAQIGVGQAPAYWEGRTIGYEDTNFQTGDSPAVLDVNSDLGRNGHDGYVICDGPGNIKVEISDNGITYGSAHTLKSNEALGLSKLDIDTIRITWVSNSGYRVLVV